MPEPSNTSHQGYFPFAVSQDFKAEYLRLVMQQGGTEVRAYKQMSFDLLELGTGLQVLDVGCGIGIDLPSLADRVGTQGEVTGIDHDPDLVQVALKTIATDGRPNLQVVQGDAEQMPFADEQFDRVRADRVVQHIRRPERAIAEMWRVLRPGGILTMVEPDWRTIALYPGSPAGGDDDRSFSRVLECYQRQQAHALIGRQLHPLLHQKQGAWEQIQIQVICFTHTSWPVVDAVLQITAAASTLIQENPMIKEEIDAWLYTIETVAQQGEFFASVPLFFASAHKIGNRDG
jgi:ubiquinone/menaquinone biosynthesis C-methylase UbiE